MATAPRAGCLHVLAAAPPSAVRFYTPHGGSLHYDAASPQGFAYLAAERLMRTRTAGIIFESDFSRAAYFHKVGRPGGPVTVIHNGVSEAEFEPVAPAETLADFLFIGELRMLKGISTLIEAASLMSHSVHIRIVGAGPDRARFEEMSKRAGAHVRMEFMGPMPAREAFRLARAVVLPSWNEVASLCRARGCGGGPAAGCDAGWRHSGDSRSRCGAARAAARRRGAFGGNGTRACRSGRCDCARRRASARVSWRISPLPAWSRASAISTRGFPRRAGHGSRCGRGEPPTARSPASRVRGTSMDGWQIDSVVPLHRRQRPGARSSCGRVNGSSFSSC